MNLVWRIVAKDFLRLRGRLAAWLAVLGAKYVLGFWLLSAAEVSDRTLTSLQGVVGGLVFVDLALTWLLAALLVHEDAVAGSAAFWRTRPISGARLLAAKAIGVAGFLILPAVLAAVPWWVACGLTSGQTAGAALEVVVVQGVVVLLAAAAASVTDSLARCLVWGLVGLAGSYGLALAWMQGRFSPSGSPSGAVLWAWLLLLAGLLAVLVVWQYLTRRRSVALGLLLAGVLLAPPVATMAVRALTPVVTRPPSAAAGEAAGTAREVTVEWESARRMARTSRRWAGEMELNYVARGVPPGHVVAGRGAIHTVHSDGRRLAVRRNAVGGENQGLLAIRQARAEPHAAGGSDSPRTTPLRSWFLLAPEDQVAAENEPLDVEVDLRLHLVRPVILDAVPVQPGAWRAQAGYGVRVMRVTQPQVEAMAVLLESEPLGVLQLAWREWHDWRGFPSRPNLIHVVERDGAAPRATSTRVLATLALGGMQLRQRMVVIGGAAEGATVIRVDISDGVPFARRLHLPGLVVK